jgi:site-specific DNA recombinase
VRAVYAWYTADRLSIGAIARRLTERGVPTRKQGSRWERSTVWAMLRNPAYTGRACFGKMRLAPRQRVTKPLRLRGGFASRNSASHEQPREHWIEIPVPAIVSEETFALAEELLERNKRTAPRRTVEPTLLQGLVSCRRCGYALYRNPIDRAQNQLLPLPGSRPLPSSAGTTVQTTGRSARICWTT